MAAILIYTGVHSRTRRGSHLKVYGPTYLAVIAFPLVLINPLDHILMDNNIKPLMKRDGTFAATYIGFACLAVSTLWNANIVQKLKELKTKWRELRSVPSDDTGAATTAAAPLIAETNSTAIAAPAAAAPAAAAPAAAAAAGAGGAASPAVTTNPVAAAASPAAVAVDVAAVPPAAAEQAPVSRMNRLFPVGDDGNIVVNV
jgi:hypothetical protein